MRPTALKVLLSLMLGATFNVAAAWAFVSLARHPFARKGCACDGAQVAMLRAAGWHDPNCIIMSWTGCHATYLFSFSADCRYCDGAVQTAAVQCSAGWPMPALQGQLVAKASSNQLSDRELLNRVDRMWQSAIMDLKSQSWSLRLPPPLTPQWPGFAVNTLIYASVPWLILGPFALRRTIRRRRGQCIACGYPVGDSPVCTECGAAVRSAHGE
jgi:hypothetical protein